VKVAHDETEKRLTVSAEISAEHLGYFCSEPTASWDGRAGGAMKVYTKVPLPAGFVSNVGIQRLEMGNVALKSRLVWALEADHGQRFIHLKSIFPRQAAFPGAVRAEFRIQLTDDRAKAVLQHADPPVAMEPASAACVSASQAPAAWSGLARLYLIQGKFEQAEEWARKLVVSGQGGEGARAMLQAAKERKLSDGLRVRIEPP
jgi:hypothetical protein